MNIRSPIVQVCLILLISQLAACGAPGFPAAAPIAIRFPTLLPFASDATQDRLTLELVWEIRGEPNHFDVPVGVAADAGGNVYIMDTNNSRIQKLDSEGNSLLMWGSEGRGEGQFGEILDAHEGRLAVDSQGNVYVIDLKNSRVQKFDSNGHYLTQWGMAGDGEGQFIHPFDIAIDQQDNIYISDVGSNTIQKFDETGRFLLRWGRYGYGDGEFSDVFSVAIDPNGNVLVSDATGRIQKFDRNGQVLSTIVPEPVDNKGVFLWSIAIDSQGDIYVADWYSERIVKVEPTGKALAAWSGSDAGIDRFVNMQDIAVDQQGNIYLTDGTEDLVRKFRQPALGL